MGGLIMARLILATTDSWIIGELYRLDRWNGVGPKSEKFKILISILDWLEWPRKTSHATVPLNSPLPPPPTPNRISDIVRKSPFSSHRQYCN